MTNELEKQFFDTFGIEPKPLFSTRNGYTDDHYIYPQITDRILLELICLFAKEMNCTTNYWHTVDELKENLLREFILDKDAFSKHQVRTLFEEV